MESDKLVDMTHRKSFSRLTIVVLSIFLLLVNGVLGTILIIQSRNDLRQQMHGRMLDILNSAAYLLDGDVLEKLQKEDVDTPEYQYSLNVLRTFQVNFNLEYIYGIRDMGNETAAVELQNITKRFGSFIANDHIDFTLQNTPALDPGFVPFGVWRRAYLKEAHRPVKLAFYRDGGQISVFETCLRDESFAEANFRYLERTVKFLLWAVGGWKIALCGCEETAEKLKAVYAPEGVRHFDAGFVVDMFERPLEIELVDEARFPVPQLPEGGLQCGDPYRNAGHSRDLRNRGQHLRSGFLETRAAGNQMRRRL